MSPSNRPAKDLEFPTLVGGPLTVEEAYTSLQAFIQDAVVWYLLKKNRKRRWSRMLRFCSIVLGVFGGLIPVGAELWTFVPTSAGYVLLGISAGLQLLDRGFGLSTGWSRHLSAALNLQECSVHLALRYAKAKSTGSEGLLKARWDLMEEASERIWQIINTETSEWTSHFQSATEEINGRFGKTT